MDVIEEEKEEDTMEMDPSKLFERNLRMEAADYAETPGETPNG